MDISLRPIDDTNRDACAALTVTEPQAKLIASNSRSLKWASASPQCVPLGIYADGMLVGFAMYEPRGNAVFSAHRFMIDATHQRNGVGRRAMQLLVGSIWQLGGNMVYLSFRPENRGARLFFEQMGFVFHENEPDGEVVYRLKRLEACGAES